MKAKILITYRPLSIFHYKWNTWVMFDDGTNIASAEGYTLTLWGAKWKAKRVAKKYKPDEIVWEESL